MGCLRKPTNGRRMHHHGASSCRRSHRPHNPRVVPTTGGTKVVHSTLSPAQPPRRQSRIGSAGGPQFLSSKVTPPREPLTFCWARPQKRAGVLGGKASVSPQVGVGGQTAPGLSTPPGEKCPAQRKARGLLRRKAPPLRQDPSQNLGRFRRIEIGALAHPLHQVGPLLRLVRRRIR